MKPTFITLLGAAALGIFGSSARAQSQTNGPVNPPVLEPPTPPNVVPAIPIPPSVVTIPMTPQRPEMPARPTVGGQIQPPAEVKDKVEAFKLAREAFLAKQKELAGTSRERLTEEQRQALLENIKVNQQEFRSRINEIKDEFRNRDIDSVIDDAKRAADDVRNRRGEN